MIPIQVESAWRGTSDCRRCGIRDMVLFADLNAQDFNLIHAPMDDFAYSAGQALYEASSKALGVFTLRKGMLKLVRAGVMTPLDKHGRHYQVVQPEL